MKTVNIGDLKANLSAHLKLVRKGEEVLVCDRNKPVARIVPYQTDDHSEQMKRLIASGVIRPPKKPRPDGHSFPIPTGRVISDEVMAKVWEEEREGR